MTTYTIQPGRKAFKPISYRPIWWWPGRTFTFSFQLTASCWFWIDGDDDMGDWNKGFGITSYFSANNRTAIMWAWRPVAGGKFEVCIYVNWDDGDWFILDVFKVKPMDRVTMRIKRTKRGWFEVERQGRQTAVFALDAPNLFRPISPWIGGANNEPGDYNSTAPHYMEIKQLRNL